MASAMHKMALYFGFAENDRYADEEPDEEIYDPRAGLRVVDEGERAAPEPEPEPELTRIMTLRPRTYNEALRVGEGFRDGVPVILDLTEMTDDDAKRLVDFAAGLTFGRRGDIDRIATKVFLLSPSYVQVTSATS